MTEIPLSLSLSGALDVTPAVERTPDQVAMELADVIDRLARLDAQARDLRAWLAENLGEGNHYAAGIKVSVYRTRRFDVTKAMRVLPPKILDECTVFTIDRDRVARLADAEMYRACQVEGKTTVRLG